MRARPAAVVAPFAALATLALASSRVGAQSPTPPPAAAGASGALHGVVHGVVHDSLGRRPLAGAVVQAVRADDLTGGRAVVADSMGRFRLDSLVPGRYLVGFAHPLLDLLRVEVAPRLVDLGPGSDTVHVDLGVPELATVRAVVCGGTQAPDDSAGLLAGRVRDVADGALVADATVVITWTERTLGEGGLRTEHRRVPVTTGPGGSYVICGLPHGETLVATASARGGRRASGAVALELPPRGFVVRDLALGDPAPATVAGAPAPSGTARLAGTVRDSAGRPVRRARAAVQGTDVETVAGDDGAFTLGGLPVGTHTLEVRAIGYALRQVPIDLAPDRLARVDVRLDRATALAPVTVVGAGSAFAGFLERRRTNPAGRFLTGEDLQRAKLADVTDALRTMPGMLVVTDGGFQRGILGRKTIPDGGRRGSYCAATIILDGMPLPPGANIDRWVDPRQVTGIEVYADGVSAPPQFREPRFDGCSVVLVWTNR